AELAQRLAVPPVEAVEEPPSARVGERLEDLVHPRIGSHLAAYNMQPDGCMANRLPRERPRLVRDQPFVSSHAWIHISRSRAGARSGNTRTARCPTTSCIGFSMPGA